MAISGNLYSSYLANTYIPKVTSTIFWNQWWVNQPFFEIVQPGNPLNCPGGAEINVILDYAVSTNVEAYVQGAPMPVAHTLSDVRAYHNKDYFQEGAYRVFHTRMVRPGVVNGNHTEMIAGLFPGEVVATKGGGVLRAELLKGNLGAG